MSRIFNEVRKFYKLQHVKKKTLLQEQGLQYKKQFILKVFNYAKLTTGTARLTAKLFL